MYLSILLNWVLWMLILRWYRALSMHVLKARWHTHACPQSIQPRHTHACPQSTICIYFRGNTDQFSHNGALVKPWIGTMLEFMNTNYNFTPPHRNSAWLSDLNIRKMTFLLHTCWEHLNIGVFEFLCSAWKPHSSLQWCYVNIYSGCLILDVLGLSQVTNVEYA